MTSSYDRDGIRERQDSEFQVLQAVFMEDIKDMRKTAWKVWSPLELQITLFPQQSMSMVKEIFVQVDLYIKCSAEYPNQIPEIDIKNSKGLSTSIIAELKQHLYSLAEELKGEVMILELIHSVQKFLHEHNKPQFKSFYEEMVSNHKLIEQKQAQALKLKEEKEIKAIQEEMQRKQEALKEEAKKRRMRQISIGHLEDKTLEDESAGTQSSGPSNVSSEDAASSTKVVSHRNRSSSMSKCKERYCSGKEMAILTFSSKGNKERNIQKGGCLGHSSRGCSVYIGTDINTGDVLAVTEWIMKKPKTYSTEERQKEMANYTKHISNIEQELKFLVKLNHANLIHYLGMRYSIEKDSIIVHILQEYIMGCTLAHFVACKNPVDINLLRHYARGITEAFHYLHENSIVHKNLRDTSVFINNSGDIKVSDFSLDTRLHDLYKSSSQEPEVYNFLPSIGKGKKRDIHRLGILLLSLSSGFYVKTSLPTVPSSLDPNFRDFLKKCFLNDEQRWGTDKLLSHPFLQQSVSCYSVFKEMDSKEVEKDETMLPSMFTGESFGNSRLTSEFEVLKWLGRGGFGDVLKVKNKLDARIYALKRIPLNPSSKQLNRKIMREVKLLSRLNHENIVRYYNSWIETVKTAATSNETLTTSSVKSLVSNTAADKNNSSLLIDTIDKNVPPALDESVQWSISIECNNQQETHSSSDEDEDDIFGTSFFVIPDKSESVIFEDQGESEVCDEKCKDPTVSSTVDSNSSQTIEEKQYQFMYIQMEFCEKSTLRTAIDNGLYKEISRVWRLFREIIEGLVHIHQQGMIHRDLKPVNIFLDSNDHVKIGDFGLATTDIISKPSLQESSGLVDESDLSSSDRFGDGSLTGKVGTALYVAPELVNTNGSKIIYTQKVDIYSLGIIFFEMCYPPLSTSMERAKILVGVRHLEILLPSDFEDHLTVQQVKLIKWLLQHDESKRPSSVDLLSSDYLPPLQMEDAELHDMLRYTVSNPQSKAYKHMISSLFQQETSPASDYTYDMRMYKSQPVRNKFSEAFQAVVHVLEKIMNRHGAIYLSVSTLMPKTAYYNIETSVHLMDHGGDIVSLPHELRVPFARYVARRDITQLKRYVLEKVYREQKVFGFHPKEQYEFAFDIITPSVCNFFPDGEVITILSEIIDEFSTLQSRSYYIQLNHTLLLKAIFLHCGISDEKHSEVYSILSDPANKSLSKLQLQNQLVNLSLTDQTVSMLFKFIEVEESYQKVSSFLQPLVRRKNEIANMAKKSLHELQNISAIAESLGTSHPILISLGLVHGNEIYSGMIFQYGCHLKKGRDKSTLDILAAGGRYDKLISNFRLKTANECGRELNQSAVGVSIAVEKIVHAISEDKDYQISCHTDFLICSVGLKSLLKEKCRLLNKLWRAGVRANIVYDSSQTLEDIVAHCKENGIAHILVLKDTEPGLVKIHIVEKATEKQIYLTEIEDFISKLGSTKGDHSETYQRQDSKDNKTSTYTGVISGSSVKVTFISLERRSSISKKRFEAQILNHLSTLLQYFSNKVAIEVLALDLNLSIIKTIVSQLEVDKDEAAFEESLGPIVEKHARYKKYIVQLGDEIHDLRFEKKISVIVLYSLNDSNYKVLM